MPTGIVSAAECRVVALGGEGELRAAHIVQRLDRHVTDAGRPDSAIATIFGVSFAVSCWLNVTSRGRAVVLGQPRSRDKGGYHGDWPGAS